MSRTLSNLSKEKEAGKKQQVISVRLGRGCLNGEEPALLVGLALVRGLLNSLPMAPRPPLNLYRHV